MPYVHSISSTRAVCLRRAERPIFSGGVHQRVYKEYQSKKKTAVIIPQKPCKCYAVLPFKSFRQVFGGLGTYNSLLQGKWDAGAKMDRAEKITRYCGLQPFAVYKWSRTGLIEKKRADFADDIIAKSINRRNARKLKQLNTLSKRSKIKIREKILALWHQAQVKTKNNIRELDVNKFQFVTLTFIDKVDDRKAVKLLNTFLTALRKRERKFYKWIKVKTVTNSRGVSRTIIKPDYENHLQYIWVVERQKNGNAHFHIIFNKQFPVKWANAEWTKIQVDAGLQHSKYKAETKNIFYFLYGKDGGAVQSFFNPYDTKAISKINSTQSPDAISAYLTGYVTKNEGKFSCATWYCSRGISALETSSTIDAETFEHCKDLTINKAYSKKRQAEYTGFIAKNDYCETVSIVNKGYYKKYIREMCLYNYWLLQMRQHERKKLFSLVDPYGGRKIEKREFLNEYCFIENTQYVRDGDLEIQNGDRHFYRQKLSKLKALMLKQIQ